MRLTAIVLVVALGGCSFVLVSGPPANHRQLPAFDCTESRLGPILDGIWTGLQLANLTVAATTTDQKWNDAFNGNPPLSRGVAIPTYAGLAALGAAGLYFGITRTGECREAKAEWMARAGANPAPGTWPPPAAPPASTTPATPPAPPPATPPAPAAPQP